MADPRGFISKQRQLAERRPVDERLTDWKEVYPGTPGREVRLEFAKTASLSHTLA